MMEKRCRRTRPATSWCKLRLRWRWCTTRTLQNRLEVGKFAHYVWRVLVSSQFSDKVTGILEETANHQEHAVRYVIVCSKLKNKTTDAVEKWSITLRFRTRPSKYMTVHSEETEQILLVDTVVYK